MGKKMYIFIALAVAVTASLFLWFRNRKKQQQMIDDLDQPQQGSGDNPSASVMPIFPVILIDKIKGIARMTKNIGNIRDSSDKWLGKNSVYNGFVVFDDYAYGVRAMLKLLVTYHTTHGLDTIEKILNRYAPSSDNNNTTAYIQQVSLWSRIPANKKLVKSELLTILPHMVRVEVGFTDSDMPYLVNYVARVNDHFKIV